MHPFAPNACIHGTCAFILEGAAIQSGVEISHRSSLPRRVVQQREGLKKQHSVLFFPERDRAHANAPSTRHPERAPARLSFGSEASRNGQNLHNVHGSTKKSALSLQFKDIFSYYLGFCEKEN